VLAIAFSADGKRLVTGSTDTTALLWNVADVFRPEQGASVRLRPDELRDLWSDLAGDDAPRAFRAIRQLALLPEQSFPFLKKHLRPDPPVDHRRIAQLIADLDNDRFEVREKATIELIRLGKSAEPALRQTLKNPASAEVRLRAERVLGELNPSRLSPDLLRALRALDVLERIGTPEARKVIDSLAKGSTHPRVQQEAQASVDRLAKRPPAVP